ncbi:MAG: tetratricopeptide repeat protein [Lachnospiraceae bacterium]|nr:tetratricopeptide repeat protein [Lachnospiraceae bacterium]
MLNKEDYEEPRCVLCMNPKSRIPIDRVLEKYDSYIEEKAYERAESHLRYWLEEAKTGRDEAGELTMLGELMGHLRKNGKIDEAVSVAASAIARVEKYGFTDTITGATAILNAGTVYRAAGKNEESAACYERAEKVYEAELKDGDDRLGGLYNNFASALTELGEYDRAEERFKKALAIMDGTKNGKLECAITYLNLADLYEKRDGSEKAESLTDEMLTKAFELLTDESVEKNAYYEFVLDKCIPAYDHFGQFLRGAELKSRIGRQ